jgi:hypothetical protein
MYKIGQNRTDNDGIRYERVGQNTKGDYWTGQDRTGEDGRGQDRTKLEKRQEKKERTGQDTTG